MAELKAAKVVSSLPATLAASTIYFVRVGNGFDLFVTNESGTVVAYSLNAPASASSVFAGVFNSASTSITLTASHHGQILVLSATTLVVVSVPASGLPTNFYCRIVSTTTGGFRVSASTGVTVGSPNAGYLAVRAINADADLYAIDANKYILKSGYLSAAFTLNSVPTPLVAISSSRRISEAYTGNLVEVRRSSDNAVQGIGTAGDALDTATLASFVGSGSAWVKTLYDQSGNGRHFTQATAGKQPRLVNAGTLDQAGGHAAVRALASSGTYLDTALSVTTSALTVVIVGNMNAATGSYGRLVSLGANGVNEYDNSSYSAILRREQTDSFVKTDRGTPYANAPVTYGTPFSYVVRWDGAKITVNLNNAQQINQDATGAFNASLLRVFANMPNGGENWDGNLCEMLVFGTALTDAQLTSLYSDHKAYYTLP